MIDHLELRTRQLDACLRFYGDLLQPLGYRQTIDTPAKGFADGAGPDFFIGEGEASSHVHFAFRASSRHLVDRVWQIAQARGHTLDRAPALAPHVHPDYYAGYARDPDGRLVEFVCHARA